MARMYEQSGKLDLAEKQYKLGLKLAPKHLALQLGYARLKDRQGQLDQAIGLYQQVARQYPQEAATHNDLGLCYARRGMVREAIASLERAIQLQPGKRLYRNNIATVLVETGRVDAALEHLRAAHHEAVACYNLGYLLEKKGQPALAATFFAKALEKDPSLTAAQVWLERLQGPGASRPQVVRPADRSDAEAQVHASAAPPTPAHGPPIAPLPPLDMQPQTSSPASPGQRPGADSPGPWPLPPIEPPQAPLPSLSPRRGAGESTRPALNDPSVAPAPLDRGFAPVEAEARRPFRFYARPAVTPLPPVEDAPLPP
jgi:Tfp pilus assembly protein PilF